MKIVLLRRIVKIRREKRLNQFDKGGIMKFKLGCSALCFVWRRQPGFLSGEGAVWNQEKHNGRPLAPKGPESLLILILRNRRKPLELRGKGNRFFPSLSAPRHSLARGSAEHSRLRGKEGRPRRPPVRRREAEKNGKKETDAAFFWGRLWSSCFWRFPLLC